jgi:hypothetical protein
MKNKVFIAMALFALAQAAFAQAPTPKPESETEVPKGSKLLTWEEIGRPGPVKPETIKEEDFKFKLTDDMKGVIITGYTGKTAEVYIPATIQGVPVVQIGYRDSGREQPFAGLSHITSVVITGNIQFIGYRAFYRCTNLTSVNFERAYLLSAIYDYAFYGCPITEIKLPRIYNLGNSAFAGTKLTSIELPSTLGRNIRGYGSDGSSGIFEDCKSLKTVTLYEGLESIGSEMFKGCSALTSITLPNSINFIGSEAFVGTSLTEITLPAPAQGRITIWSEAFKNIKTLTTVNVPAALTRIEFRSGAGDHDHFKGCSNLTLASQMALRKIRYSGDF